MDPLEPCPACRRHVKISETACPFCSEPLAAAFADVAPRALPRSRLGRAATFAFGAIAMTQAACGGDDNPPRDAAAHPDAARDAGVAADADGGGVPIYAAAPTPDASRDRG